MKAIRSQQVESVESLLSVSEVAARLGVHVATVRRWIDRGELPAYRIGKKRVGVKESDLGAILSPRTAHPPRDSSIVVAPLTPEEQRRGWEALARLRQLSGEAGPTEKMVPSSSEVLNELRDQRTRELLDTVGK